MDGFSGGIESFAAGIPRSLLHESGKVFYAGRNAFSAPARLYVVGLNPGGDPANHPHETVGAHTHKVIEELPADWSAYRDEVWEGAPPGTYGMAPRILHLLQRLELEPGSVPSSNLFFVRSRREEHIRARQTELSELCWPFHARVIAELKPGAILCLGATAGGFVRRMLGATRVIAEFIERNERRWKSQCFQGAGGVRVIVATHPSIADWTAPPTDPSALVLSAMH